MAAFTWTPEADKMLLLFTFRLEISPIHDFAPIAELIGSSCGSEFEFSENTVLM